MKLSGLTACTTCGQLSHCPCGAPRMLAELADFKAALDGGFSPLVAQFHELHCDADSLDPGVSTGPFAAADVVEIGWLVAGQNDGPPWLAIVRLADGRWVYASHTFQVTGDLFWTYRFAATRDRLWFWACSDDDRARFGDALH